MREKSGYSYRRYTEEDEPALIQLLKNTFPPTHAHMQGNYWVWKYKLNPNFDPSLVVVAERNGKVVGCNHWLIRDFKLSGAVKVKASLGADIAVHPKHRRRGVGKALLKFFRDSKAFREKGAILTYMFAERDLSKRLYEPTVGYVAAPKSTTLYKKFLNCQRLKKEFQPINKAIQAKKELQKELKGFNMHVLLRLRGLPTFSLDLARNQVDLIEGGSESTDVIIEGDFHLFYSALKGKIGTTSLIKALLTRKLKVKKGKWKLFKLSKFLRVLKLASSGNREDLARRRES